MAPVAVRWIVLAAVAAGSFRAPEIAAQIEREIPSWFGPDSRRAFEEMAGNLNDLELTQALLVYARVNGAASLEGAAAEVVAYSPDTAQTLGGIDAIEQEILRNHAIGMVGRPGLNPQERDFWEHLLDTNGGWTSGEPHLKTLDGYTFDFQAIGDFLLVSSASGDLEIQARQQLYRQLISVSVNTGIAVRSGMDRLEWSLGQADVLVNGSARPLAPGGELRLRDRGLLRRIDEGFLFISSAGDRLTVVPANENLDLFVRLAWHRRGRVRGLLGNCDGDPDNDLQTADGKLANVPWDGKMDASHPLYAVFGNSWRVAPARSLFSRPFVAPPGMDPKSFPQEEPEITAAQRAAAEAFCRAKGLQDLLTLENCTFDVIVTGSSQFAASAMHAERIDPPPKTSPDGADASVDREVTGTIDSLRGQVSYVFTLEAKIYFFDARGSRGTSWSIRAPDQSEVLDANQGAFMGEYPARVAIAVAGRYRVKVTLQEKVVRGRYRFRVRTVPVHAPKPLALGTVVEGRIASVGEELTYALKLRAGKYDFRPLLSDNTSWNLISPAGDAMFDANQQVFMEEVLGLYVPENGTYLLRTQGRGAVGLGSYRLEVVAR